MLCKYKTKTMGQREEGMDEEEQKAPLRLPSCGQKSVPKVWTDLQASGSRSW